VNGEGCARVLTGLAVLAVAVVAGIVSFTHIETLALAHGYALGTARLLPVSVDGLIVAASLACLTEARTRGEASRLSRAGLVLGILATLAANVAAGAHFGITGAVVNAWPAIAFIVASEILLRMPRAARDLPSAEGAAATVAAEALPAPATVLEVVADTVPAAVLEDVPETKAARTVPPVSEKHARAAASGRSRVTGVKTPEKVFAAEIEAGRLPSLRAIKAAMHVGTDRARVIRTDLAATIQEAASRAA
jgi:Protein of unknown function (DUF2637)